MDMKQVSPEIQDLGVANGWKRGKWPVIALDCKHETTDTKIGKTRTEVRCDICGYRYEYDSS
ncbi:hypothetical protein LCGC14_2911460 [marine sediment metagenome]|uniref:Uncharacterized protein n=1 Tax=marine sediment metagenome TaxID=412755 RepID=A0A0F8ZZ52_9ZZZZ